MRTRLLPVAVCLVAVALPALAADWPQWRGPDRSGVSRETALLKTWPKGGPPLAWTYTNAGLGFSSIAVVGDRLYTLGALGEVEYLIAVDIKGDKPREAWKVKLGPIFTYQNWGDGPRSAPTVAGKHVYGLGGYGELVCVEAASGTEVWRKNLAKDLDGELMTPWGYSESPLLDGDKLICTPGGEKGTLAALNAKTGAVLWRSTGLKNKAPYSSVVLSEAGGVRQYVQQSFLESPDRGVVSGFDPRDGKVLWTAPVGEGDSFALASTPLVQGNLLYVTAGYGYGCHLYEIAKSGGKLEATDQYGRREQKKMKNQHGGVVLGGGHVYGHSEGTGWVCQDFKTGRVAWSERAEGKSGSIVAADGMLYLFSDEAEALLVKADPARWDEQGRFTLPQRSKLAAGRITSQASGTWTHPVIANGRLYLRDQELVFCFDIKAKK
jgi:outer membrane protein assembly factor BamB